MRGPGGQPLIADGHLAVVKGMLGQKAGRQRRRGGVVFGVVFQQRDARVIGGFSRAIYIRKGASGWSGGSGGTLPRHRR